MESLKQKRWLRVTLYVIGLIAIGVVFLAFFPRLIGYLDIPIEGLAASAAYLVVFGITLLSNASVLVPVAHVHVAVMMAAATFLNPFIVALVASVAGTLGEITGYYAGYLGKRIVHLEDIPAYHRLVGWMRKYGILGIFLISLQPLLPVDVGGLLAGASRLPLRMFLLPCWAGKLGKYLLACYLGAAILELLPPLPFLLN